MVEYKDEDGAVINTDDVVRELVDLAHFGGNTAGRDRVDKWAAAYDDANADDVPDDKPDVKPDIKTAKPVGK